jgi:hypothetical protein
MDIAKVLALVGVVCLFAAGLAVVASRYGGSLSWPLLPGDIVWKGKDSTFVFPVTTCLVLSAVLSLLIHFGRHFLK